MTELWKLTDGKHQTRGGLQWGEGVTHTASGNGELCTSAYLHAYTDPLLAVALAPIHVAYYPKLVLWRAEGVGEATDGLKVGCTSLTTIERVPLPEISTAARVRWAIMLAYPLCEVPAWRAWADAWLSGANRSTSATIAAADAAALAAAAADAAAEAARAARAAWAAEAAAARAAWAAEAAAAVSAGQALDLAAVLREAIAAEVQA